MKSGKISWLALALGVASVTAGAATPSRDDAVLRVERERLDATLRHDTAALERMTTPDLTYVHASGLRQDRVQYLAYVKAGGVTFGSYSLDGVQVRRFGTVAVTHGVFNYTTDASAPPVRAGKTLYTGVYVLTGGAWRLEAWEATKIP